MAKTNSNPVGKNAGKPKQKRQHTAPEVSTNGTKQIEASPSDPQKEAAEQIQMEGAVKFLALLDMAQKLPEMPITAWTFRNVLGATFDALVADLRQLPAFSDTAKDKARHSRQRDIHAGFDQIIDVVDALTAIHPDRFEAPEAARSALCAMLSSVGAQIRDLFSLYQVQPEDCWTTTGIVGFPADQRMHQDDRRAS